MREKEFASNWVSENRSLIKNFPEEFLDTEHVGEVKLPDDVLVMGPEMFGQYEILDSNGNPVIKADSYIHAKYILYSNRNKPKTIQIPVEEDEVKQTVKKYEKYLDELLSQIKTEFESNFPKSKQLFDITNHIFSSLNLKRY